MSESALLMKDHSSAQIKNNEMCGILGTYGEEKRCTQGLDGETCRKEITWQIYVYMGE